MSIFLDLFNDFESIGFSSTISRSHSLPNSTTSTEKEYLDQFFDNHVLNSEDRKYQQINETQPNFDHFDSETNDPIQKKGSRQKSKFHNYQKHLIITLRKTVMIEKHWSHKYGEIVRELWSAFCNSRIYNKSLLRILFGQEMLGEQLNIQLFKTEGFRTLTEKYSSDELIQAQHALRRIVLQNFEEHSLDDLLKSRKLPLETKALFKKYISQFIIELKEGNVMKRLPKWRKKEILKGN